MYQFRFRMEYIYICSSSKMNVTWMFLKAVVIWVCEWESLCNQNPVRFFSKFQLQFEVSKSRKRGRGRRGTSGWKNQSTPLRKHWEFDIKTFFLQANGIFTCTQLFALLACFTGLVGWYFWCEKITFFSFNTNK